MFRPDKHSYNTIPVEHKTIEHGNKQDVQVALQKDAAAFMNTSTMHDTKKTASTAPVMEGEHTHHHVHHHIQPVIQKETIQPEYIHTQVPIHETHHAAAIHHEATALPAKTLEEYAKTRGDLDAHSPRSLQEYSGCPTVKDKSLRLGDRGQNAIHGH
jgi:hypothetical protein